MQRLLLTSVFAALPFAANAADLYNDNVEYNFIESTAPAATGGLATAALFDISGGYRWVDLGDEFLTEGGTDAALIDGAARISIPFGGAFSLQLDAQGEYNFTEEGSEAPSQDNAQGFWLAGAHASWRDPNTGLLGIFGAAGEGYNTEANSDGDVGWMAGVEGQLYMGNLTLYAQGGYADFPMDRANTDEEGFNDGWFVRGVARLFAGANSLIEAEVSYAKTDTYIDGDNFGEFWGWGVKGKTRIAGSLYGVLGYRGGHYETDDEGGETLVEHIAYGGISVAFGTNNLADNNLYGATLDLPTLPVRASAIMEGLD